MYRAQHVSRTVCIAAQRALQLASCTESFLQNESQNRHVLPNNPNGVSGSMVDLDMHIGHIPQPRVRLLSLPWTCVSCSLSARQDPTLRKRFRCQARYPLLIKICGKKNQADLSTTQTHTSLSSQLWLSPSLRGRLAYGCQVILLPSTFIGIIYYTLFERYLREIEIEKFTTKHDPKGCNRAGKWGFQRCLEANLNLYQSLGFLPHIYIFPKFLHAFWSRDNLNEV